MSRRSKVRRRLEWKDMESPPQQSRPISVKRANALRRARWLRTNFTIKFVNDKRNLREQEDWREFHPMGELRHAKTIDGLPAKYVENAEWNDRYYDQRAFDDPARVVICKRRQRRREIMFSI